MRIFGAFATLFNLCSEYRLIHFQDLSPLSSQHSPSTTASWNQAIDPRLFSSSNGIVTSSPFPAQTTSTSSELANALILPTPRAKAQSEILQQPPDQTTTVVAIEESLKPSDKQQSEPPNEGLESSSGGSTRFCSVKGCKAVIPGEFFVLFCQGKFLTIPDRVLRIQDVSTLSDSLQNLRKYQTRKVENGTRSF